MVVRKAFFDVGHPLKDQSKTGESWMGNSWLFTCVLMTF
jgi:hypothetical protein